MMAGLVLLPYNDRMFETAHTYHPTNNTFEERVRSYKTALDAYRSLEVSANQMGNKEWANRLGTSKELSDAETILTNSLKMATNEVTAADVRKAEAIGWLDPEDMKLIARFEREQEMKAQRKNKSEQQNSRNNQFRQ